MPLAGVARSHQRIVGIQVQIEGTNYGGELRRVVNQTLDEINAKGLDHPCLPGRKLKFRLVHRSEMELKMDIDA